MTALLLVSCLLGLAAGSGPDQFEPLPVHAFTPAPFPQDTGVVDHEDCQVDIRLFPSRHRVEATASIAFRSLVDGLGRVHFTLYNDTLRIRSVTSGPDTLAYSYDQGSATLTVQLRDTLGAGERDTVLVRYDGYITSRLGSYCRLDDSVGFSMIPYVWYPAAYDLYNSSRRDDFSSWRITLTVPRNWCGLSCGVLLDSTVTDSTLTYTWQPSRPYVAVSFGAGPYQVCSRDRGGLQLRYYDRDTLAAAGQYAVIGTVLDYLERTFGEVTLDKLAFFDHQASFGAAHPSLVMMPLPNDLYPMAHEIGHHWWGISVNRTNSDETWLNEGFATYMSALLYEDSMGVPGRRAAMDNLAAGYLAVPPLQDRAIVPDPTTSQYRNAILYQKGAWVLHMLRGVLGDSAFFAGMRTYAETFRDSSVVIDDFRLVMEQVSGRDLAWFFNEWLYWTGAPEYDYGWRADSIGPGRYLVAVAIEQPGPLFTMPVQVSAFSAGAPMDTWAWVDSPVDTARFEVATRPDSVILDREDWVLDRGIENVGVEERPIVGIVWPSAGTVVRGVLWLGRSSRGAALLDVAGRQVLDLKQGPNDVGHLSPGVYFAHSEQPGLLKVIVTR